jgi:hypothetical protein
MKNSKFLLFFLKFLIVKTIAFTQNNLQSLSTVNYSDNSFDQDYFKKLDSLFVNSEIEKFVLELKKSSSKCDSCIYLYKDFLSNWSDTVILVTKSEIINESFIVASDNIKILDDLSYYCKVYDVLLFNVDLSNLKCFYNSSLLKKVTGIINKASNLSKYNSKINETANLISEFQVYKLKFFRDSCFDRQSYGLLTNKFTQISILVEKQELEAKLNKNKENQPVWIKMGMSYEDYQEWWARKLTVGSTYMGGGCNSCGKNIFKGKRGGVYYINSNGNKQYIPRK